jgi:hypothetical protein
MIAFSLVLRFYLYWCYPVTTLIKSRLLLLQMLLNKVENMLCILTSVSISITTLQEPRSPEKHSYRQT